MKRTFQAIQVNIFTVNCENVRNSATAVAFVAVRFMLCLVIHCFFLLLKMLMRASFSTTTKIRRSRSKSEK